MPDETPATPAERPRLLIAEDDLLVAFALREFFCDEGFSVDCVVGLAEGQRMLDRFQYSALLTDVHLSGHRRGEGLFMLSKARERQPAIRVIVMTAFPSPQVEYDARRLGADDVLAKPVGLPALHDAICKWQERVPRQGDAGDAPGA